MAGPFWAFLEKLIVELIFERYTTKPCQEKNPDQNIVFFHGEIQFQNVEFEQYFMQFAK